MIKIWNFISGHSDGVLFVIILIVLVILFAKEFDLTNRRSLAILFGLMAIGGIMFIKGKRNKRLLAELKEREEALKQVEKEYEELRKKYKVDHQNYIDAKIKLENTKRRSAIDILRADETYKEEVKKLEEQKVIMTAEEMIENVSRILNPQP